LFVLTCVQVELETSVLGTPILREERVLHFEFSDILLGQAAPEDDKIFSFYIFLLPSVAVVEAIVIGQLKPLDFTGVLAFSFHDSISSRLLIV
jgi:hypothetical protein